MIVRIAEGFAHNNDWLSKSIRPKDFSNSSDRFVVGAKKVRKNKVAINYTLSISSDCCLPKYNGTFDRFLRDNSLYVNEVELEAWVNPNSVETTLSSSQMAKKEEHLSQAFKQAIHQLHRGKGG